MSLSGLVCRFDFVYLKWEMFLLVCTCFCWSAEAFIVPEGGCEPACATTLARLLYLAYAVHLPFAETFFIPEQTIAGERRLAPIVVELDLTFPIVLAQAVIITWVAVFAPAPCIYCVTPVERKKRKVEEN